GGAEVVFELNELIDHEGWKKAFLQYCRLTTAPKETVAKDNTSGAEGADGSLAGPGRLAAYAYAKTGNRAFVARAISQLAGRGGARSLPSGANTMRHVEGADTLNPVDEVPSVST